MIMLAVSKRPLYGLLVLETSTLYTHIDQSVMGAAAESRNHGALTLSRCNHKLKHGWKR